MKKNILTVLVSVLITLGIAGVIGYLNKPSAFMGGDTFSIEPIWFNNYSTTTTLPRTSGYTTSYLSSTGASSTFAFFCEGASMIDFNLMTIASSTDSKLQWELAFSDDYSVWFYEDGRTVDSAISVTHGASPVQHYWTPGTTATSTKNITITPVASRYCQIRIASTGAAAGIWAEALLKKAF